MVPTTGVDQTQIYVGDLKSRRRHFGLVGWRYNKTRDRPLETPFQLPSIPSSTTTMRADGHCTVQTCGDHDKHGRRKSSQESPPTYLEKCSSFKCIVIHETMTPNLSSCSPYAYCVCRKACNGSDVTHRRS